MPYKNVSNYIKGTLISIINQTYQNWELLAVNDHSTDESFEIVKDFNDNRIINLNNSGKGIINALQTGYSNSKGSFITRMDADDLMTESKIELMTSSLIEKGENHITTGLVKYFSDGTLGDGYIKYQNWLNNLTCTNNNFQEIYKECVIPSPCWMVHRDDFEKCEGFNSTIYPEDYDLTFRFYQNNLKVIGINETLHLWRDYPERTSRNDDNYADNRFLTLKIHYFLTIDYNPSLELVLWGAGKKGKQIAKKLIDKNINFSWICNSKNKIGVDVYQKTLFDSKNYNLNNCQVIIAVAGDENQTEIKKQIETKNNTETYYFC